MDAGAEEAPSTQLPVATADGGLEGFLEKMPLFSNPLHSLVSRALNRRLFVLGGYWLRWYKEKEAEREREGAEPEARELKGSADMRECTSIELDIELPGKLRRRKKQRHAFALHFLSAPTLYIVAPSQEVMHAW
jgi:hypothetical protein